MPEETITPDEPKAKKTAIPAVCGHENKHYKPPAELKGKRLFCTLEKGHAPVRVARTGPKGEDLSTYEVVHSAPYQRRTQGGTLVDAMTYWSDAAGTAPNVAPK